MKADEDDSDIKSGQWIWIPPEEIEDESDTEEISEVETEEISEVETEEIPDVETEEIPEDVRRPGTSSSTVGRRRREATTSSTAGRRRRQATSTLACCDHNGGYVCDVEQPAVIIMVVMCAMW